MQNVKYHYHDVIRWFIIDFCIFNYPIVFVHMQIYGVTFGHFQTWIFTKVNQLTTPIQRVQNCNGVMMTSWGDLLLILEYLILPIDFVHRFKVNVFFTIYHGCNTVNFKSFFQLKPRPNKKHKCGKALCSLAKRHTTSSLILSCIASRLNGKRVTRYTKAVGRFCRRSRGYCHGGCMTPMNAWVQYKQL